jgi:predicted NAD/FAD-dependent oxidoreductase
MYRWHDTCEAQVDTVHIQDHFKSTSITSICRLLAVDVAVRLGACVCAVTTDTNRYKVHVTCGNGSGCAAN